MLSIKSGPKTVSMKPHFWLHRYTPRWSRRSENPPSLLPETSTAGSRAKAIPGSLQNLTIEGLSLPELTFGPAGSLCGRTCVDRRT